MSHFMYIHKDLTGEEDVWKIGVTMTPYSAVRARQKFSWKEFGLDYLFFGRPKDISALEQGLKRLFKHKSGKILNGFGTQTEMFQINIDKLLESINTAIDAYKLDIIEIKLDRPYTASSSGQCPFGIPSEKEAEYHLNIVCDKEFGGLVTKRDQRYKQYNLERMLEHAAKNGANHVERIA